MKCKNCEAIVISKFCSNCGQNSNVSKITISKLLQDLTESIFQFNSGLLFTLKELFTRPGNSIQEYLLGKRKNHFKPIAYVLVFSTIYFLITRMTSQNTWVDDLISGFFKGAYDTEEAGKLPKIVAWFANNYAYTTLLLIPIFSLASYLSFRKYETNYLEHIVLNCYTTGHQAICYTIFSLLNAIVDFYYLELFPALIATAYIFWVFSQFFDKENRFTNFLRSILTYILYFLFSITALLLIVGFQELYSNDL